MAAPVAPQHGVFRCANSPASCSCVICDSSRKQYGLAFYKPKSMHGHSTIHLAFALPCALQRRGVIAVTGEAGRTADVVIWDLLTGQVKSRFCEHNESGICSLALSHDERLCLSVGHAKDQRLFVLDTSTGAIVCKHNLEWGKVIHHTHLSPICLIMSRDV